MNNPLVSVIIPCYKVARYVRGGVTSVLTQTYPQLEVIAVDDGSPDDTPAILDELAATHPQLRVIHQPNAGVSAARNAGLACATGEYVVFVDADDFLAPDAVAYWVELAQQTKAEFCLSTDCFTQKGEVQNDPLTVRTLTREQAVALLMSPRVIVGCWNKIYKRSLLLHHHCRFATDLFYGEGLNFITTVAQLANAVGVGNKKVYYYRRNNEVSATSRFDIKKVHNGLLSIERIEKNLTVRSPHVQRMFVLHRSMFCLGACVRLQAAGAVQKYQDEYNEYLSYVRRHYGQLLCARGVSLYRKCLLLGGCISPWMMAKLDVWRRKRIAAKSVE